MRPWVRIPPPRLLGNRAQDIGNKIQGTGHRIQGTKYKKQGDKVNKRRKIIAVIGGADPDEESLKIAEKIGSLIAQRKAILITGGMGGVMNAASRGAKKENGLVIGILPTSDKNKANPYVDIPIVTGMSEARNIMIARTCDGAIAIDGRYGTLSEIAYCLMLDVPVIGINTWEIAAPIIKAKNAEEAVDIVFERILK